MQELDRICHGLAAPPAKSFEIEIQSPHVGSLRLAAVALPRRATVVTLVLEPDGSSDLSQNILRLPGLSYREPVPNVTYERRLRDLQLGQKLYESGDLAEERGKSSPLSALFDGTWIDPILSCMACFSVIDAAPTAGASRELRTMTDNITTYFGALPDSRVVHGLVHPRSRDRVFGELLESSELPVLARTADALVGSTKGRAYPDSAVAAASRRTAPGAVWLSSWTSAESNAKATVPRAPRVQR